MAALWVLLLLGAVATVVVLSAIRLGAIMENDRDL